MSPAKRQIAEFGPLAIFFAAYWKFGFVWATGALVASTVASIALIYAIDRKVAKMQLFTAIMIVVFGGLTVYFKDPTFLKIKVSIINLLLASVLLGGLKFKRLFIRDILGQSVAMPDGAWRTLTMRWAFFFLGLAFVNVFVWQFLSEAAWLAFKVFGILGLSLIFAMVNAPFMMKHMTDTDENPSANG